MASKCPHGVTIEKGWCDDCINDARAPVATRPGTQHVPPPSVSCGKPVAMIVYRDSLYVAFEFGVYKYTPWNDDKWEQILTVGPQ